MVATNINRKSAQSQVSTCQETLRDYKTHMTSKKQQQTQQGAPERDKTTSVHRVAVKRSRKLTGWTLL
ncbi:TPA: hypothetical protein ACWV7F_004419 [Salmonella enterica subsp. enterica serovar Muenchen]|nr:hypothetical protein [Salmonella enterica subsp. enterica serovar Enteritidis]EIM5532732.1 hypothetical protein [Salmonella enterica subsp. enterica]